MTLSAHAQRQVQQSARELVSEELPGLEPFPRNVLVALTTYTAEGWHLLVRRDLLMSTGNTANAFLIGPGGVFAVLICEQPPGEAIARAALQHAQERSADIRGPRGLVVPPSAIHLVVVLPGAGAKPSGGTGLYWQLAERDLPAIVQRDATHLTRRQAGVVVEQIASRLPDYAPLSVSRPERAAEQQGLLEADSLAADELSIAQQRPFDSWLTFLHPQQQAVVTRNYNGPARISGPAGTGKTVVALHRLRYLARRSTGPLLFTTFARIVPKVHQKSFERLAPEMSGRVRFSNLHAWAREFLEQRGRSVEVHSGRFKTEFNRAWLRHRDSLQDLENDHYWWSEVDRVIKGRGISTLRDYMATARTGRSLRLSASQKELVWQLYETYQDNLARKGLHDYNDMIRIALEEVTRRPLDEPFAAVVVDEVQDITLTGLRLLRELAGDGPNRLLLIGDGQQQVYPGGWRLSEAGIPIQGRGEVLRVNYRNRRKVLDFAQQLDATNQVDDLDGGAGVALRDVESVNAGGQIHSWRGSRSELPEALIHALRVSPVPTGHTALIVHSRREVDNCLSILRDAEIPAMRLDNYDGEPGDAVKVGTVHGVKGLDFQAILAVHAGSADATRKGSEPESRELQQRQQLVAATRARDFLWWGVVEASAHGQS